MYGETHAATSSVLSRAAADVAWIQKDTANFMNSPAASAIRAAMTQIGTQAAMLDGLMAAREMDGVVLKNYRSKDDISLEEQFKIRQCLARMLEVLTGMHSIQQQEVGALTSLDAATRSQGRWTPWLFAATFGAMLAAVAAVVVPFVI